MDIPKFLFIRVRAHLPSEPSEEGKSRMSGKGDEYEVEVVNEETGQEYTVVRTTCQILGLFKRLSKRRGE